MYQPVCKLLPWDWLCSAKTVFGDRGTMSGSFFKTEIAAAFFRFGFVPPKRVLPPLRPARNSLLTGKLTGNFAKLVQQNLEEDHSITLNREGLRMQKRI
jgi:hypothetical protein